MTTVCHAIDARACIDKSRQYKANSHLAEHLICRNVRQPPDTYSMLDFSADCGRRASGVNNFTVAPAQEADWPDLERFLNAAGAMPPPAIWQELKQFTAKQPVDVKHRSLNQMLIVVDRLGMIRGFCLVQCIRQWPHHRVLDIPVLIVEDGENQNTICRALYDHATEIARTNAIRTVHFHRLAKDCWWSTPLYQMPSKGGVIVPIDGSFLCGRSTAKGP